MKHKKDKRIKPRDPNYDTLAHCKAEVMLSQDRKQERKELRDIEKTYGIKVK